MLNLLITLICRFLIFCIVIFLIVFGAWLSLPEFVRALITAIVLFAAFLFFTRKTRKRIYEEIERKEKQQSATEESY